MMNAITGIGADLARPFRALLFLASLTIMTLPHAGYAQGIRGDAGPDIEVMGRRPAPRVPADAFHTVVVEGAVTIIGFGNAKPNDGGTFKIDSHKILFSTKSTRDVIPLDAVRSFAIEHSTTGLMRGTKSMMASYTPQGVGQLYSLFRPGAETLTMIYADENHALHGAVLNLPKERKDDVVRAFADAGLVPSPVAIQPDPAAADEDTDAVISPDWTAAQSTLEIEFPVSRVEKVPAAFVAAIYEETIARLVKTRSYARVLRAGDDRADTATLLLTTTITQVKKGNAGLRGAVPVIGMIVGKTQINADVELTDARGRLVLRKALKGSKRMVGENIGATRSLAERVARTLEEVSKTDQSEKRPRVASR